MSQPITTSRTALRLITAILGCMFSEKSAALIASARRCSYGYPRLKLVFYKPVHDKRKEGVYTRVSETLVEANDLPGTPEGVLNTLREHLQKPCIIVIDELQFVGISEDEHPLLSEEEAQQIMDLLIELMRAGCIIFVAGLDADYACRPFPLTRLLQASPYVNKRCLTAVCERCKCDSATHSQLLIDGEPASGMESSYIVEKLEEDDSSHAVGIETTGLEPKPRKPVHAYVPRCIDCYVPPLA